MIGVSLALSLSAAGSAYSLVSSGLMSAGTSTSVISVEGADETALTSAGMSASTVSAYLSPAYHWDFSTNAADPVASVTDAGLIASNLTGTGATDPTRGTINSLNSGLWDNTDDLMTGDTTKANFKFLHGAAGPAATGALVGATVLMVCRRTGQTNNDTMLCTAGNAPGAAQTGVLLRGNPAAATISLFVAQGGGVSFAINGAAVGSITVNNTSVVWYALDASAYVTGVNTTDGASGAPAVAVASGNSTGNLIVGNGTSTNPFQGHFCDVVAYNYKLSVAAIHLVVTALQAKWGST